MVEFCSSCGTSLPKGDLTIRGGRLFTSHDFTCPTCRQPANPEKIAPAAVDEPDAERDLVIRNGSVTQE